MISNYGFPILRVNTVGKGICSEYRISTVKSYSVQIFSVIQYIISASLTLS